MKMLSTNRIQVKAVIPPSAAAHRRAAIAGTAPVVPKGVRPLSSVLKTLAVLEVFAGASTSLRLAEVARITGGNRGSIYQKLMTLVASGWLEQTDEGAYRLTLRAGRMGEAALRQASLGDRAQTVLRELMYETGETASLAVMDGASVYLVRRVEAEGALRADLRTGTELQLHSSASGRVLCAFAETQKLQNLRERGFRLPSEDMMARIRRERTVVSSGRDFEGVLAIGAPVFDAREACVAALTLVAPAARFNEKKLRAPLSRAAERLSAVLHGL